VKSESTPGVVSVKWLGGHRLRVKFDNGEVGEFDLAKRIRFRGLLKPLKDPAFFSKVFVDEEIRVICWPGDLDFDPIILHHYATGAPMPKWAGPIPNEIR
jgi:hypothetical protein